MRRRPLFVALVLLAALGPLSLLVGAQQNAIPPPNANCQPDMVHLVGQMYPTAIEPEFPVWCYTQPAALNATRAQGSNSWVDTFDNDGPSITQFNDHAMGYRVFDNFISAPANFKAGYFVNVNHWMVDLVDLSPDRLSGGVLVSPDQTFAFENGTLVVEVDAAAGSDGMGGANRFYEIDLTPATAPTNRTVDALYGYGAFGYVGAMGCRLERNTDGGNFVCAMYDNSGRATDGRCVGPEACSDGGAPGTDGVPGRVWETQGAGNALTGATITGNQPGSVLPGTDQRGNQVWRQCATNELDLHCRDRFRMEVTKTSIHLYVNGYLYYAIDGLTANNPEGRDARLPDSWFQTGVRPYFTSWVNGGQHTPTRWHWDRIAVNPHDASGNFAAPSSAPSFCLGQPDNTCPDPVLPGTPTGTPTMTPAPGGTATAMPTFTSTTTGTVTSTVAPPTTTASATLVPTSTPTPLPTATTTPTETPLPSATVTSAPTATSTAPPECEVNVKLRGVERGWVPC